MADNEDLLDYEDEEQTEQVVESNGEVAPAKKEVKGTYVSIHSSGFRDFLLKPEILRAIVDCGFEHPSEGIVIFTFLFISMRKSLICKDLQIFDTRVCVCVCVCVNTHTHICAF